MAFGSVWTPSARSNYLKNFGTKETHPGKFGRINYEY
jgi:hypothetical protein